MKRWILSAALFAIAGITLGQTPGLYIQMGRWEPDVSGSVTTDVNDALDIASDLALDSDSPTLFSAKLLGRKHVLIYTSWKLSVAEDSILEEDLYFGDLLIPAGERVESAMSMEFQEAQYRYLFLSTPTITVGGTLAYQVVDTSFSVFEERLSSNIKLPAAGLAISVQTPRSKVYGDLVMLYGQGDDAKGTLIRAEAGVDIFSSFGLFLGAQLYDLDMDFGANNVDYSFSGIYAGIYLHL